MAFEGAPVPADRSEVILYKIARGIWNLFSAATPASVVLAAGSAILGKVGIDQTTPGVTNAVQTKQSSTAPSSFAVRTAAETVFTLAAGERGFIQNLDDAELHVKLGAGASTSSFNFLLKANSATDKADGGYIPIQNWIGAVSVAPATGTARYVAWKI